jgi:hypothetical protein
MRNRSVKLLPRTIVLATTVLLSTEALFSQDASIITHHSAPPLQTISRFAIPSNNGRYIGYYVGGGCARRLKADPRRPDEGTWGWDFQGALIPRLVNLGWWHGRRYQGGTGAYKTDGPHYHAAESSESGH